MTSCSASSCFSVLSTTLPRYSALMLILINIKAEYLGSVVESTEKQLDAEQLVIDDVDYADVVIHDGSKQSKIILDLLNKKWESQGKQARIIEADPLDFNSNQASDASEHTLVDGSMVKVPSFLL